jgi:hypothetical protein
MNQVKVTPANTYSGHSGLALAARLKALNVNALIVDKLARVGNSWRRRYKISLSRQLSFLMLNSLKDHKVTHASVYRSLSISGFSKRLSRLLDPKSYCQLDGTLSKGHGSQHRIGRHCR